MKNNINEIALITGASSGIGKSLAEQLANDGYKVVIAARSINKLNEIANKINSNGGKCLPVSTDLADINAIEQLKEEVLKFGKISIVINNAGVGKFNCIEELSISDWDLQLDINLKSPFLISKTFIPYLKQNHKGVLVFINSIAGLKPFPHSSAYVASKFGLRGFAHSLREELREYNIKVISVYPGAVNTPFWDQIEGDFPKDEMLNAKDLAQSIAYSIQMPGNLTIEELVVRRVAGDF